MTNMEIRVRGAYDQLSGTEKKVADYFLKNMDSVFRTPIARLAEKSGVSQVAWVRFCKDLGFSGLKDMKHSLFAELNEATGSGRCAECEFTDIKNFSNLPQIAQSICQGGIQSIEDTVRLLEDAPLEMIVRTLIAAPAVFLFGVGASGQVAADFYSKLIRIGKRVLFDRDIHIQLTYAATLTKKDAAVLISNSGLTKELLDVLAVAKKSGAACISITRYGKNPLADGCGYSLYTSAPEVDRRSGATSSRIAQLTLVDILFTALANLDYPHVENSLEKSYEACRAHRLLP